MRKIYLSQDARRLTFMLAGKSPATVGERAALRLSLPRAASDFRWPPPPGRPNRPGGDSQ
jgi:hypothetical protein